MNVFLGDFRKSQRRIISLIQSVLKNSVLLLLASALGRLVIFIINWVAARLLSQDLYGQYSMIRVSVGMIENILTHAFGVVALKRTAESQSAKELFSTILSVFIINTFFVLLITCLVVFNIDLIVEIFFVQSDFIKEGLLIATLLLLFSILSITTQKIFIGLEYYKEGLRLTFYIALVSLCVGLLLLDYLRDVYSALYAIIFYYVIDFGVKVRFLVKSIERTRLNLKELFLPIKTFFSFSYPLFIAVIISSITFWYGRVILVDETGGYVNVAIYDAAYQLLMIIMIITGATTSITLSMLSRAVNETVKEKRKIFILNLIINLLISCFISVIFITFASEIMSIYGTTYVQGAEVLIVLSVVSIFFTLSSLLTKYAISIEHKWIILMSAIFSSIILFYLLYDWIEMKELALAYAMLGFYITSCVVYTIYLLTINYKEEKVNDV